MNISERQIANLESAISLGLTAFNKPAPMTAVEWADENFYLSAESSYVEGRWETLHFQVAILNAMGNDEIRVFNLMKSARVGYSQMLKAALAYMLEHKKRNQILFQPTDSAANSFMKAHIETMIRDVPLVRGLAPWLGKKHKDNTLEAKLFTNKRQLWCLGGTAAKNYREKSVDTVVYDELAAFPSDVEKEGSPTSLGDTRLEGAVFGKSIRGSTPKLKAQSDDDPNGCQIERAAKESEMLLRYEVPCPHCGHHQDLKWGGPDESYGFKWIEKDAKTAAYLCENCDCLGTYAEWMPQMQYGFWADREINLKTFDGIVWTDLDGKTVETPEAVSFHIWSAYSPFTDWTRLVGEFFKAKNDPGKLKTFVNTKLGETWDDSAGEKLEPHALYMRREFYQHPIPVENCILTAAVDVQDDRLEYKVKAWTSGEESYNITYKRLYGDLSRSEIWEVLARELRTTYQTPSGLPIDVRIALIDSGGHYTDEVYGFSKKYGVQRFVPLKGHSVMGKPIADFPRKRNKQGVYLTMVGTDTAKEIIADRLRIQNPGEGFIHFPRTDEFDEEYFKHLTNERKVSKIVKGRRVIVWDSGSKRNEPWDLEVYNLAAIRVLQQHFGINLNNYQPKPAVEPDKPKPKAKKKPKQMLNLES